MYKVIRQFSPNIELVDYTEPDRMDDEFNLHTEAMDFYTSKLAEYVNPMSDLGGELVITLIGDYYGEERILKRHVLSTTILVI
jgi:hypothetical protein